MLNFVNGKARMLLVRIHDLYRVKFEWPSAAARLALQLSLLQRVHHVARVHHAYAERQLSAHARCEDCRSYVSPFEECQK
jgi:hypothetical protein